MMLLSGLVILMIATSATYWPWINAYGVKRLLPFPIQLFTTWDGPDDVLIQTGQYYADRNELSAWERRRLASLARKWYLSENGTVYDAFLRPLEHLVDDKEAVVEELFRVLPTVDDVRRWRVLDVIWALSSDRPAVVRRVVKFSLDMERNGLSPEARAGLAWIGQDQRRFREHAGEYFQTAISWAIVHDSTKWTIGHDLQNASYPMASGLKVLTERQDGESRIRGLEILAQMERYSSVKQGLRQSDVSMLMQIARTGDAEQAVKVATFISSIEENQTDIDRAELVRPSLETGSDLEKLAALGVLSRCVGRAPIPGYTRLVLDRLVSAPDEHAVEFSRTILRQTPPLERTLVVAALPGATPPVQLVLIDAIANWAPADESGLRAIRELRTQPTTMADVREAATAALERINALPPDE